MTMKIFRIASPDRRGSGGEYRAYKVLAYLGKRAEVVLVPPVEYLCRKESAETLDILMKNGVKVPEGVFESLNTCKLSRNPMTMIKLELDYYSMFVKEASESDAVFSDHELYLYVAAMSYLKRRTGVKSVLLNQAGHLSALMSLSWNLKVRGANLITFLKYLRNIYTFSVFKKYSKDLDLLLGVSKSSIEELKKLKMVREDIPLKALNPPLAIELEKLPKYDGEKENYAVFFARLIPEKGIFDLLKAWREVRKELGNVKLVISGRFYNKGVERKFMSLKSDSVVYNGFLPKEELYSTVTKAKVFIYPTHFDSFSIVMLESLALRTPVVAYALPAIAEVYGGLDAVKLVSEFDVKGMARKTIEIFRMKEEDYHSMFNRRYDEFMAFYSSWERVAEEEYNTLKVFLEQGRVH